MKKTFILAFFMMFCSFAFAQNAGQNAYDWGEFEHSGYPNPSTIFAVINLDGELNNSSNFEIAPFCGDTLRGKAVRVDTYAEKDLFLISAYGYHGDIITFKLYDYGTETLYDNVSETVIYWNDGIVGSYEDSIELVFKSVAETKGVNMVAFKKQLIMQKVQLLLSSQM